MRFEPSSTMSVSGDDISPSDSHLQPHPHLTALIKWWVSCVWGVAGLVLRRLLPVPHALPALPALGCVRRLLAPSPGASPSPAEPEPSVTCSVLCDPPNADVDVIFVHGLYGSLPNTWKQGQWRSKYKTGPKRIPLKRHVSLPENNYNNDINNNVRIHNEPRVKKKNKSEEYCSCDDTYYTINVKKQSGISNYNKSNTNNISQTILRNNSQPNKDKTEEYTLEKFSKKEVVKRRQTVPNIISRKIPRTEIIETIHIDKILKEITNNPTVFNVKIDEMTKLDDNSVEYLGKILSSNNNDNDLLKTIYQYYISMKETRRNDIKRKSILNTDFARANNNYKSLSDDLNQIFDRIEYFISKLNSPGAVSEVRYQNLYDENICDCPNETIDNNEFDNYSDILNNKSKYRLGDVANKIDESASIINNITSNSELYDCDKVVCDYFKEVNSENVSVLEDLQNDPNYRFKSRREENMCVTSESIDLTTLNNASLEIFTIETKNLRYSETEVGTAGLVDDDMKSENLDFDENYDISLNSFSNGKYLEVKQDSGGNNLKEKFVNEKTVQNNGSNSDLNSKTIQESDISNRNDAEDHRNEHPGEAEDAKSEGMNDANECSEVSDDSYNGKSCEVGCGCVCSKCYSTCWPRDWLRVDCPRARVIAVNYTSDPYLWRPIWIKEQKRTGLQQRADEMVQQLLNLGVGQKPIVWVGHSKGGLFIKQIYTDAYESYCASHQDTKESSVNATKYKTDRSENENHKCFDKENNDNAVVVEELTNENFSVRLETELNDERELNFEESFAKNSNNMMSDVEEDFCFDIDSNIQSDFEEKDMDFDQNERELNQNRIDFEEYVFTSINMKEMEKKCDRNHLIDVVGDQFLENEILFNENHGMVQESEVDFAKNLKIEVGSRFVEKNPSFGQKIEDSSRQFDTYCPNCSDNKQSTDFDSDSCDALDVKSSDDTEESKKSCLWSNTKGFMFYSVPHRGSPLAGIRSPLFARSVELLEISENCASVLALQGAWLRAVRAASPRPSAAPHSFRPSVLVRSFVETARTLMAVLWLRIVSVESADAGVGELCGVGLDHREICKPSSRSCFLYRELLALIQRRDDTATPHDTQRQTHVNTS